MFTELVKAVAYCRAACVMASEDEYIDVLLRSILEGWIEFRGVVHVIFLEISLEC